MDLSEVKHLEQPQIGSTLKLSEAIRVGVEMRPRKCRNAYFAGHDASCALGAAWEAVHGNVHPPTTEDPGAAKSWGISADLLHEIVEKNDGGWSRERIADWLEAKGL